MMPAVAGSLGVARAGKNAIINIYENHKKEQRYKKANDRYNLRGTNAEYAKLH